MRAKLAAFCVSILASAGVCAAQTQTATPLPVGQVNYSNVYCSGFISDPKVPDDMRVISGEQSSFKIIFSRGDNVYLNRGADQGVKIGDVYAVVRPDIDPTNEWFYGQTKLTKRMGTIYRDIGQIRVVSVATEDFDCRGLVLLRLHGARRCGAAVRRASVTCVSRTRASSTCSLPSAANPSGRW